MSNIFIKPASIEVGGEVMLAFVRDPMTLKPLDEHGEWKPRSQFWNRRLRDKDVIEADPTAVTPAPAAPAAPAFDHCANCVTQDACAAAGRCVKAPIA